ncbi:MAG: hypothetical protein QHH75_05515 [Bacillota bacterium]|nr:hypothetical protein [Bacillota bacterium]
MHHYHDLVRRAVEIDLEEIRLLASAARTAPPGIRPVLLSVIVSEAHDIMFWNALLAFGRDDMMPPPSPIYEEYYPYQEKDDSEKE